MDFTWTIVALVAILAVAWRFLGSYMAAVLEGRVRWLAFAERPLYRVLGIGPEGEQSWQKYAGAVIIFSGSRWPSLTRYSGCKAFRRSIRSTSRE